MHAKSLFDGLSGNWTFLVAQMVRRLAYDAGDPGSIPGLGRSPGEGNGNPLQYSCLENPKEGGAWWATVHGVAKSQIRLSDFTFLLSRETTNSKNFWADFHDIN